MASPPWSASSGRRRVSRRRSRSGRAETNYPSYCPTYCFVPWGRPEGRPQGLFPSGGRLVRWLKYANAIIVARAASDSRASSASSTENGLPTPPLHTLTTVMGPDGQCVRPIVTVDQPGMPASALPLIRSPRPNRSPIPPLAPLVPRGRLGPPLIREPYYLMISCHGHEIPGRERNANQ